MTRIIIDNQGSDRAGCTITDDGAAYYVSRVMAYGRVSEAGGIPHFCWFTRFPSGVVVKARRKRSASAADSFIVRWPVK